MNKATKQQLDNAVKVIKEIPDMDGVVQDFVMNMLNSALTGESADFTDCTDDTCESNYKPRKH
jgi:hypothetical protein